MPAHPARTAAHLAGLLLVVTAVGCSDNGPLVAEVSGTVTLDGEPVPNVSVFFEPENGGRMSNGTTDASGRYELVFSTTELGAKVGRHRVRIVDDSLGDVPGPKPPPIPPRYGEESELLVDVWNEPNTIDLKLVTDEDEDEDEDEDGADSD